MKKVLLYIKISSDQVTILIIIGSHSFHCLIHCSVTFVIYFLIVDKFALPELVKLARLIEIELILGPDIRF